MSENGEIFTADTNEGILKLNYFPILAATALLSRRHLLTGGAQLFADSHKRASFHKSNMFCGNDHILSNIKLYYL